MNEAQMLHYYKDPETVQSMKENLRRQGMWKSAQGRKGLREGDPISLRVK